MHLRYARRAAKKKRKKKEKREKERKEREKQEGGEQEEEEEEEEEGELQQERRERRSNGLGKSPQWRQQQRRKTVELFFSSRLDAENDARGSSVVAARLLLEATAAFSCARTSTLAASMSRAERGKGDGGWGRQGKGQGQGQGHESEGEGLGDDRRGEGEAGDPVIAARRGAALAALAELVEIADFSSVSDERVRSALGGGREVANVYRRLLSSAVSSLHASTSLRPSVFSTHGIARSLSCARHLSPFQATRCSARAWQR